MKTKIRIAAVALFIAALLIYTQKNKDSTSGTNASTGSDVASISTRSPAIKEKHYSHYEIAGVPREESSIPANVVKAQEVHPENDNDRYLETEDYSYSNPPPEVLEEDQISPNTIFNQDKFTAQEIKEIFEASLTNLQTVTNIAKIEDIECTQKECKMIVSEKLPERAQAELYSYYLERPQFGKWIHSDRLKEDPSKIVYTFSDN